MKVIYLLGLAHCGSTFTSMVLNQHSEIFTAGELCFLDEDWSERTTTCKCLTQHEDREVCDFWSNLYTQFKNHGGDPATVARMDYDNRLAWIKSVLSPIFHSIEPKFEEQNELLFELISKAQNCPVILDTSKKPWRLIPLLKRSNLDIHILHLIKSPTNQLRSRVNRGYNFWHSAFLKYWRKNYLSKIIGNGEQYKKIKFEEFVDSPDEILNDIFEWVGLESENVFDKPQQTFHHFRGGGGKRLFQDIQPDPEQLTKIEPFTGIRKTAIKYLSKLYE